MPDTLKEKQQDIRSQVHLHITKICIYTETENQYIENDLDNEVSHIFPLRFFFYNTSLKEKTVYFFTLD